MKVLTVKDLKEKLKNIPDDVGVIAIMGKERFDGDVVDLNYDDGGLVVLEVVI